MQTWWSHSGHVGEGKRTFTSFSQGNEDEKDGRILALIARCITSSRPCLSLDNISLLIAAHPLDILFFEEIKGFVAKRKEKLIFPITDKHYRSFGQFWQAKNWMSEFEARNRKLCTIIVEFN